MYHGRLQIAICQLESHPALKVGDIDFLREPFVTQGEISLTSAARANLQVTDLRENCRDRYLEWHLKRLKSILEFLAGTKTLPDIVVFPEGAIPFEALQTIRDVAIQTGMTIFAGTHTIESGDEWQRRYRILGLDIQTLKEWEKELPIGHSILPIFYVNKTFFRKKNIPSIFEITNGHTTTNRTIPTIEVISLDGKKNNGLTMAPLICSEALHQHSINDKYQIAVVCAYNTDPNLFDHFIEHNIRNQSVVILANDGRFGGSGVFIQIDTRTSTWWWSEPIRGRLPKGDGIVRVEVDLDSLAPQVGVNNPSVGHTLREINAVTYEFERNAGFKTSQQLENLSKNQDNTTQAEVLGQLLTLDLPEIQRSKLNQLYRLAKNNTADENAWAVFGKDCKVANIGNIHQLEESLAESCANQLTNVINAGEISDERFLGHIAKFIGMCRKRAQTPRPMGISQTGRTKTIAIIDRQEEIKELINFLNDDIQVICFVVGINGVGKTSVLQSTLEQSGHQNIFVVRLVKHCTPNFIWASLLAQLGHSPLNAGSLSNDRLRSLLGDKLPHGSILLIENAHYCLSHHAWRDPQFSELFQILYEVAYELKSKMIVETTMGIEIELAQPNMVKNYRIYGLKDVEGANLLKQQIRRVGLDPQHYSSTKCSEIVKKLGGHPGAIILAAEYIERSSIGNVLEDIQRRKGSYSEIVRRIIKELSLTEEESVTLALLSLARRPVPANVIANVTEFDGLSTVRNLYSSALIERYENDHIAITELLRDFADLPILKPDEEKSFHEEAAKSFAALANEADLGHQLEWAVESKYHAIACGRLELSPGIIELTDGALAAAKEFVEKREYEKAKPIVDSILSAEKTAESLELAARIYANLGSCEEALTMAKEATKNPISNTWIITEVGRCALIFNKLNIAKDAVKLAKKRTTTTFVYVLEGRIYLKEGNREGAIEAFENGVRISERDGWPHFYLGRELIQRGDIPYAIEVLEKGDDIESNRHRLRRNVLVAIWTQLGIAHLLSGDDQSAEVWLKLVAEEGNPEVARAFTFIRVRANKGAITEKVLADLDPQKAQNRFERCQIHLFRGLFYLNAGLSNEANTEFQRASEADPRNIFVLLRWAESFVDIARDAQAEGDPETARNCGEQAKSIAERVLKFDSMNKVALKILENLCDEFNIL